MASPHMKGASSTRTRASLKVEKVCVGSDAVKLTDKEHVEIVQTCPLEMTTNQSLKDLPVDFSCDHTCSVVYREGYKVLGLHPKFEKLKDGCRIEAAL
jgi:hypothetical protein